MKKTVLKAYLAARKEKNSINDAPKEKVAKKLFKRVKKEDK